MCTYLISWTYADKLHTLKCIIYFHNVQQHAHKKTSSKTGFTLVCHSFINYYIFLFKKCQTKIFLHFFSFMHYNRHEIKKPSRLLKREITRNSLSSPISRLIFLPNRRSHEHQKQTGRYLLYFTKTIITAILRKPGNAGAWHSRLFPFPLYLPLSQFYADTLILFCGFFLIPVTSFRVFDL